MSNAYRAQDLDDLTEKDEKEAAAFRREWFSAIALVLAATAMVLAAAACGTFHLLL